jgi:predicted nucleic acid-binding protein
MCMLASLRSDGWTTCPELVDDFVGIRTQKARDPYPLFFIDKVELEIAVKVTRSRDGGIKLAVLDFAEVSAGRSVDRERGHVVKVSLSPLLSRDAILVEAIKDERVRQIVTGDSVQAFVKEGEAGMAGERE